MGKNGRAFQAPVTTDHAPRTTAHRLNDDARRGRVTWPWASSSGVASRDIVNGDSKMERHAGQRVIGVDGDAVGVDLGDGDDPAVAVFVLGAELGADDDGIVAEGGFRDAGTSFSSRAP